MKAIVYEKYGPPEVLRLEEVEKPVPKDDEVLIRVRATAATASDCIIRSSRLPINYWLAMRLMIGFTKPRKPILGLVLAGDVESVGKAAKRFRKGEQVYGFTGLGFGAYAEYKCMPEDGALARMPDDLTYEQAAAVPYGGILASHYLKKGNVQNARKVLVYGASGAIGTTAVQLARYFGAEVTGVCGTSNLELVKSLGADKVIDYAKEDSMSGGERYDLVLDAVGKSKSSKLKARCKEALSRNGKYVSVDDGSPKRHTEHLVLLKELIEAGHFEAVIDRCYPLEQIVEAHRYVEKGHKKGNVIITIARDNSVGRAA